VCVPMRTLNSHLPLSPIVDVFGTHATSQRGRAQDIAAPPPVAAAALAPGPTSGGVDFPPPRPSQREQATVNATADRAGGLSMLVAVLAIVATTCLLW
jgi:hypothetical protein